MSKRDSETSSGSTDAAPAASTRTASTRSPTKAITAAITAAKTKSSEKRIGLRRHSLLNTGRSHSTGADIAAPAPAFHAAPVGGGLRERAASNGSGDGAPPPTGEAWGAAGPLSDNARGVRHFLSGTDITASAANRRRPKSPAIGRRQRSTETVDPVTLDPVTGQPMPHSMTRSNPDGPGRGRAGSTGSGSGSGSSSMRRDRTSGSLKGSSRQGSTRESRLSVSDSAEATPYHADNVADRARSGSFTSRPGSVEASYSNPSPGAGKSLSRQRSGRLSRRSTSTEAGEGGGGGASSQSGSPPPPGANDLYLDAMYEMDLAFQHVAAAPPTSLAARGRSSSFGGLHSSGSSSGGGSASGAYRKMSSTRVASDA